MKCCQCDGYLVTPYRLEFIKGSLEKDTDDLKHEAASEFKGDTTSRLKCPRCHFPMEKQRIPLPVMELQSDYCRSCSLVWFDGGELALLQLGYQISYKSLHAQDLQDRMKALEEDPERKARFEECLKKLPPGGEDLFAELLGDAEDRLFLAFLRALMAGR